MPDKFVTWEELAAIIKDSMTRRLDSDGFRLPDTIDAEYLLSAVKARADEVLSAERQAADRWEEG